MGHVPFNLASYIFHFLSIELNKAFAEVIGEKVNRGAGYGVKIPCVHLLYGPGLELKITKELIQELAYCCWTCMTVSIMCRQSMNYGVSSL